MVIGASVHPQPPYQDLQAVRFLHSVQFFGSIYDTSVTRYDSFVALASKNARTSPVAGTQRLSALLGFRSCRTE